jgi:hypothetical protein
VSEPQAAINRWSARWPPEILLLVAVAMAVAIAAPLNTDTGYSLVAGRRLLDGDRLYVDMMETNPPMIFWIAAALAFVGRHLPISDAQVIGGFVATLILICSGLALAVWQGTNGSRLLRFGAFGSFFAALLLPFVMWTGQREQIAALLTFPYIVLASRAASGSSAGRPLTIAIGALAAVGLAIKPFFLAAWIACELAVIVETRRWPSRARPEFWTVAFLQVTFGIAVLTLTPEYLTTMAPLARAFYGAYGRSYTSFLHDRTTWMLALAGLTPVVASMGAAATRTRPLNRVFGVTSLGWLAAYVMQGKGWYYQLIPAVAFGAMSMSVTLASFADDLRNSPSLTRRVSAIVGLVMGIGFGAAAIQSASRHSPDGIPLTAYKESGVVRGLADYLEHAAAGEPVYFLSTGMWPAFPVVNLAGATWPYHYHFLWPIPGLYARRGHVEEPPRRPEAQGPLERQFFETVVRDLTRTPPRVMLAARGMQQAMGGRDFDFVEYFAGSAEFRTLLARYEKHSVVGWDIYERIGP